MTGSDAVAESEIVPNGHVGEETMRLKHKANTSLARRQGDLVFR